MAGTLSALTRQTTPLTSYAQSGSVFFVFILTGCAGVRRRKRDGRPAGPLLPWGFRRRPNVGGSSAPLGIIWDWRPRNAREHPSNRFPHEIPPSVRIAVKDGWKGVSRAFCRIVGPAGRPCMVRPRTMVGYGRGIKNNPRADIYLSSQPVRPHAPDERDEPDAPPIRKTLQKTPNSENRFIRFIRACAPTV